MSETKNKHGGVSLADRLDSLDARLAGLTAALEGAGAVTGREHAEHAAELRGLRRELADVSGRLDEVQAAQAGLALVLTPMATAVLDVLRDGWRKTRKAHKPA